MQRRGLLVILAVSTGLNLVLGVGWYLYSIWNRPTRPKVAVVRPMTTNILRPVRTNFVLNARILSWRDLESEDYLTYIGNLRNIECPEQTIRDIIVADVNEVFAERRDTELGTIRQEWWVSSPDSEMLAKAEQEAEALDAERRALLDELLGEDWEASLPHLGNERREVPLDGPLLGELSAEVKRDVRRIALHALERRDALDERASAVDEPVDAAEVARLEKETREQLARVLSPEELEEYRLRYSRHAAEWRAKLAGFDTTAEEFRALFRATDDVEARIELLSGATDAASIKQVGLFERQREESARKALGEDRYAYMKLTQDPLFQRAKATAREVGASAESVLPLYEIDHATEQERLRVLADANLSPEEQTDRLAAIQKVRLDTLRKLLGEEAFLQMEVNGSR